MCLLLKDIPFLMSIEDFILGTLHVKESRGCHVVSRKQ
jgi:hypothetical protein